MQIIDLFSGIGGFSVAGHSLGWRTLLFCEKEKFAQQVLRERFPGVPIFDDVCKLTGEHINGLVQSDRPVILTGGFPCQPFSVAGAREGSEDSRHLWPEMYRIIREVRPDYIIGENVPGLLSIEGGVVFEQVCLDLEAEGYEVQAFVLPACATGAPHRRDRVWIVAYSQQGRCGGRINPNSKNEEREVRQDFGHHGNGVRGETEGCGECDAENPGGSGCDDGEHEIPGNIGYIRESGTGGSVWDIGTEDAWANPNSSNTGFESLQQTGQNRVDGLEITADSKETECEQPGSSRTRGYGFTNQDTGISPNTNESGLRGESNPGKQPARTTGNYWNNWPSVSPFHSGYDGLSPELVRHIRTTLAEAGETPENIEAYLRKEANWLRKESIKCAGNAIVPQVSHQIMRAIDEHHKRWK